MLASLLVGLIVGITNVGQASEIKELFNVTEGKVLDWAIASSVEPTYYRDLIHGRNAVGAQFPIVYFLDYFSCDFGYVSAYEGKERGTLMVGGSFRLNKLIMDIAKDRVGTVKEFLPNDSGIFDKLWFGPWLAHQFVEEELSGGIKAGLSF